MLELTETGGIDHAPTTKSPTGIKGVLLADGTLMVVAYYGPAKGLIPFLNSANSLPEQNPHSQSPKISGKVLFEQEYARSLADLNHRLSVMRVGGFDNSIPAFERDIPRLETDGDPVFTRQFLASSETWRDALVNAHQEDQYRSALIYLKSQGINP